ncbi:MAG: PadR family transcriptional regulator [Gemmatimonadales bacterium]
MPAARPVPLSELDLRILCLLTDRELHGYAIVQQAAEEFPDQPPLEIGSLYRIISRLLDQGFLREVDPPAGAADDRRARRYYTISAAGRRAVRAEVTRLRALLDSPALLRLFGPVQ